MSMWETAKAVRAMDPKKLPETKPPAKQEDARRLEYMPLVELKRAKRNPKAHDVGLISASVSRFGYVEPVVVDERTGRMVAGHGRVETLSKLEAAKGAPPEGIQVNSQGEWCVPVVRGWKSADDREAEAFLIGTNRTQEMGGWDETELRDMLQGLASQGTELLAGIGYDGDDLDTLITQAAGASRTASEEDHVPTAPGDEPASAAPLEQAEDDSRAPAKVLTVKSGDLYRLGDHRLLVGDSTLTEDVDRLLGGEHVRAVIADPPYAIFGSSTGIGSDIADDKMVRPFFEAIQRTAFARLADFGHCYLFTDWRSFPALWEGSRRAGMKAKNALVWDKGGGGLGSMWAQCYELIGFFVREPVQKSIASQVKTGHRMVNKPNILRFNRPSGDERHHNAAKPVGLLKELVEAACDVGDGVLDLFSGSGSVMVACEQTGRRCFGMEIEPKFAQVSIERWENLTGKKAEKIGEAAP